ncbi:hypothetical protein [Catenuloplanes japonicus]|uniref:hypothetical protein n=1 Tax=Catenuloplanes japonicus TaxID=33876 RepID=UPI000525F373|nr:hypothetical protein [Catenuloplanes japonicus]
MTRSAVCSARGWAGDTAVAEVERDDGVISRGDAARCFRGPEFWSATETALLDRARGRVLDIGCGAAVACGG